MQYYNSCKICNAAIQPIIPQKKIYICSNCNLIFYQQQLEKEEVSAVYKKLYHSDFDVAYHVYISQQQQILKGIQPILGYNKNVILKQITKHKTSHIAEIGAGVGIVGKYLTDKGFDYTGIELEQSIAEQAKAAGINIQPGSYEKLRDYPDTFDALLAFEVIEHIDDLKLCLQLIHKALKANGKFGFTVPNFNKRKNYANDPEKLYQPNPPVHINFFTKENISSILNLCGFKVTYLKIRPFPDLNLRKKLTYLHLLKAMFGMYEGSTIVGLAVKQ